MKKFIATLLSALVGVFGYTLTDSVVEDRISKLETEIVELREEIAEHNESNGTVESLEVGDYIKISSSSLDKFLLRENEEGNLEFIHPSEFDQIQNDDIFVYLTDVTCQVIDFETVSFPISKGKNYQQDNLEIRLPVFSIIYKGYFDGQQSDIIAEFSVGLGESTLTAEGYKPYFVLEKTDYLESSITSNGEFEQKEIAHLDVTNLSNISYEAERIYYSYGSDTLSKLIFSEDLLNFGLSIYDITLL